VAPEKFIQSATSLRRIVDRQGDTIIEEAIAALYANGTISRHIKKVRKIYGERRDFFCDLLEKELGDHITFKKPQGGMSVWTTFNELNLKDVSAHAIKKGLLISDGSLFNLKGKNYNSTRMGFASLNLKELEEATGILKSVVKKM
jgi:GntR family transcriptional regulator/MocR family aminotransferase